jgi:hypothetical protein
LSCDRIPLGAQIRVQINSFLLECYL